MNYILLNRFGVPTMRRIISQMEQPVQLRIRTYPRFNESDVCIRWACSNQIRFNGAKVINRADAISLACNKKQARMKMQNEEVSVPFSWFEWNQYPSDNNYNFIMRSGHHRKGKNFFSTNITEVSIITI